MYKRNVYTILSYLVRNAVAVVVALGVIGTIPVFAESYDMEDGHPYNNATSSGEARDRVELSSCW